MKHLSFFEKLYIPDYFKSNQVQTGNLEFDPSLCTGCGICVKICPGRALIINKEASEKKIPFLEEISPGITGCMSCGDCKAACPKGAITIKQGYNAKYFYKKTAQDSKFAFPKRY
jgi:ferredoxin